MIYEGGRTAGWDTGGVRDRLKENERGEGAKEGVKENERGR